jgi:aryl-alcohol dehydrogenase-like predicted oxidoreductase
MEYRKLGKWGVKLSCLGLGSWLTIGGTCDKETSVKLIETAYDHGVYFFDTADSYGKGDTVSQHGAGEAEELLGQVLKAYRRSSFVLLTKVNSVVGPGPNDQGLSAKHIIESCHASLRRLQTDYLDIFMCHRPNSEAPLEETVRAMEDLARQGKILYWGVSEFFAAQIVKAQATAKELGARPMVVNEPRYNLLYRKPEHEVFPVTAEEGIGNVTFSPLAHGVLTGKYRPGHQPPKGTRAADPTLNWFLMRLYWSEEVLKRTQDFAELASDLGVTAAQLAIAWVLRRPEVTTAILGATKVAQLEDNLKAAQVELSQEVLAKIEELFPLQDHYPSV